MAISRKVSTDTRAKAKITLPMPETQKHEVVHVSPIASSNMLGIANQVVGVITGAIQNPKLDVRKMQAIMDMQMQVVRYQAEVSFNQAMVACQASIPQISSNCVNKHTKSRYANLEAIDTVIRPIIARHGFSLNFNTEQVNERHIKVICTVRHVDGHKEIFSMVGELDDGGFKGTANKTGIQAAGSSSSYLERYLIKLIFFVVIIGEDNDGNRTNPKGPEEGDNFHQRMKGEGTVIDNMQDVTPMAEKRAALSLNADRLRTDLAALPKKAERIRLINKNLPLLRNLDEAGMGVTVEAIHQLADQGA